MLRFINVFLQYIIPQHFLSSIVYRITRSTNKTLKNNLIRWFTKIFSIDMSDYHRQSSDDYLRFNDFFISEL